MNPRKGVVAAIGLLLALTLAGCGGQATNSDPGTAGSSAGEQAAIPAPKSETPRVLRIPKEAVLSCADFTDLAPEVLGHLELSRSDHKEENGTFGQITCSWETKSGITPEYSVALNIVGNNASLESVRNLIEMGYPDQELHSDVFDAFGGMISGDLDPGTKGTNRYTLASFVPHVELHLVYGCGGSSDVTCREAPVGLTTDTGIAFLEDVVEAIAAAQ